MLQTAPSRTWLRDGLSQMGQSNSLSHLESAQDTAAALIATKHKPVEQHNNECESRSSETLARLYKMYSELQVYHGRSVHSQSEFLHSFGGLTICTGSYVTVLVWKKPSKGRSHEGLLYRVGGEFKSGPGEQLKAKGKLGREKPRTQHCYD
jgi:hypothetical protein